MKLENDLIKLGLTDKEGKVYVALLELGQETVQNISKKSRVNRATTYVILKSLMEKGLASTLEQDGKTYFIASHPEALKGLFELQKSEIEQRQRYLDALLPELKLINNKASGKPSVKFYETKQGIINCFEEFLLTARNTDPDNTIRMIFPQDKLEGLFTEKELDAYRQERVKRKAKAKSLYNSTITFFNDNESRKMIHLNEKQFPFSCDIGIYGDNVRILSLGEKPSSILITDKEVAKTLKSLFELAWEAAQTRAAKQKK